MMSLRKHKVVVAYYRASCGDAAALNTIRRVMLPRLCLVVLVLVVVPLVDNKSHFHVGAEPVATVLFGHEGQEEIIVEEGKKEQEQEQERRSLDSSGPYVYSKMATIVPDPLLWKPEEQQEKLEQEFQKWHFWDGEEDIRPGATDYCAEYPHRDVPGDFFPEDAWQGDAVFVNHILNDADQLVSRAMEAIFTEYGRGHPIQPEDYSKRAEMFQQEKIDLTTATGPPEDYQPKIGKRLHGGWTTDRSQKGLIRRLLHAMMTNDEFVVVLGGDATSAGHGNHFRQSYMMHFHRIMAPILARMGVKLITKNMAMGHGLGTIQSSLGFSSLIGRGNIDVLIWDGEMTESIDHVNLFFRQALLSSSSNIKNGKIPFLLIGGNSNLEGLFELLKFFHNDVGADVGHLGTAMKGVPLTTSIEQAQTLPEPFQFLHCPDNDGKLCQTNKNHDKHCIHCWVDRSDIPNPKELFPRLTEEVTSEMSGEAMGHLVAQRWWYPGWQYHQLLGRNFAYMFLDSLQDAVSKWSQGTMGGPPLEDDEWHVGPMYEAMRSKVSTVLTTTTTNTDVGPNHDCLKFATDNGWPARICTVPLQGATEHTPRPNHTSLTDIVILDNADDKDDRLPSNPKTVLYEGQDVHNQCLDAGNMVVQVAGLRRLQLHQEEEEQGNGGNGVGEFNLVDLVDEADYMPPVFRHMHNARIEQKQRQDRDKVSRALESDDATKYQQGKGWSIHGEKPGQYDGEYLSICGRDSSDNCPLLGYHDSRGEIIGNDACGWLVLSLANLKEGIIIIKYSFYNKTPSSTRHLRRWHNHRQLTSASSSPTVTSIPNDNDSFAFEFTIDGGPITSWSQKEMVDKSTIQAPEQQHMHHPNRMETLTLLDDTSQQFGKEEQGETVQVAIRVKGCKESCIFALSHIYWA